MRFRGTLRQVVEGKKFIRRTINSTERQTDNNMVGTLGRVQGPRIGDRQDSRGSEKRNGVHMTEVGISPEDVVVSEPLVPRQETGEGAGSRMWATNTHF